MVAELEWQLEEMRVWLVRDANIKGFHPDHPAYYEDYFDFVIGFEHYHEDDHEDIAWTLAHETVHHLYPWIPRDGPGEAQVDEMVGECWLL